MNEVRDEDQVELDFDGEETEVEVEAQGADTDTDDGGSDENFRRAENATQKRIDRLTKKMREAERQRDEALNYAKSMNSTNSHLQEKLKNSDSSLFKEYDNRVQSDIERAKIHLREAQDAGDAEGIANATESLSRASAEAENLKRLQAQQAIRDKKAEQSVQTQEPVQLQTNAQPAPDPKAEAWAKENSWFGQDTVMTFTAFGIQRELVEDRIENLRTLRYELERKLHYDKITKAPADQEGC